MISLELKLITPVTLLTNRMDNGSNFCIFYSLIVLLAISTVASSKLSPYHYSHSCPNALSTIKKAVQAAVLREPRMGASLLRLHFHDCFVNGCDGSVLLDPAPHLTSEKLSPVNVALRGFEVVDHIKSKVDAACGRPVVSCADILAVAARDSVVALGGQTWRVELGRRDSTSATMTDTLTSLPSPNMDLPALIRNFKAKGLDQTDLVALSGAHTLGFSQCTTFRDRIYNATTNIDPIFAKRRKLSCPAKGGDSNLAPFDVSPVRFDVAYFNDLVSKRGLLGSDQALYSGNGGGSTDGLVRKYRVDHRAFASDFGRSMIKMGNIGVLTGKQGQIRLNCRKAN